MRRRAISRPSATLLVAAALGLSVAAAHAGPCSSRIAQFEQAVRQSAGNPNAGPMAPQSIGAQLDANRRRPRSDAPRNRRKRHSRRPWRAPSVSINKEIELGVRGRSPPPGECTICDDRLARGPFQTEFREAAQVGKAAAPPPEIGGARARQRDAQRGRVSRRTAVVAAVIAAATIVAGGLAFQFLTGWRSASSSGASATTAATFVGSETCAGCHRARSAALARLAAPACHAACRRQIGARRFRRCDFDHYGVRSRFFRKDGKFFVETDGPDGKLAAVRSQVHVRRRSAAAISGRVSRRAPAGACRSPGTAGRRTRAASAGFISIRTRRSSTTTCCTGPG